MHTKTVSKTLALFALVLLVSGCAQPPQQEMDAAKSALSGAESAQAAKYAATEWDAAQQAMNAAQAEVDAQNAKFALFRSYGTAKELIAAATTQASQAREAAVAGKERARSEAQAAFDAAAAALDNAQTQLADLQQCPRQAKGFRNDLEVMSGNLTALTGTLGGVQAALQAEDFDGAKSQAETLRQQAETLGTDLATAKAKIGCGGRQTS